MSAGNTADIGESEGLMRLFELDGRIFVEITKNYLIYIGTVEEVEEMDSDQLFMRLSSLLAKQAGMSIGQSKGVH